MHVADVTFAERTGSLADVTVVDADTHISEWADLWTSRAPKGMKDRMPHIKVVDGRQQWVIDGDKILTSGANFSAIRKDGHKSVGAEFIDWKAEDATVGSYDLKARLAYMDEAGIHAQIAYPNVLGFGGQKAMKLDAALRLLTVQIYNDAMAEMQEASGNRVLPMVLLPWWDVKLAATEVRRCAAMGMRGVNTNSDPQAHDLPDLGDPYWHPLWEACIDNGMPVNFHIGASDTSMSWYGAGMWPSFDNNTRMAFGSTMMFMGNARVISNIILSRFLENFPDLNVVSVESGIGYMSFLLEALEYQMHESGLKFKLSPLELFRRQIYVCSWFERRDLVETARALSVDNILFETDYPHPTCLHPNALQYVEPAAARFSREERAKIFGGNAMRIYNIDTPVSAIGAR